LPPAPPTRPPPPAAGTRHLTSGQRISGQPARLARRAAAPEVRDRSRFEPRGVRRARGLGGAGRGSRAACALAGRGLTKSHAPHRDREIVGRPPHTTCMRPARPRVGARWGGVGEGQGRTPGSRRRSREDEGTQHHMRFRSPLLCLPPPPRAPLAPHCTLGRAPRALPSTQPLPLLRCRRACGLGTAPSPAHARAAHAPSRAPKSRPVQRRPPPAPALLHRPPLGGRG
jgi:hypothetical protein